MISTKTIICGLQDVPYEWIFEHYLVLPEKLYGQDVKIKSVFGEEKIPSMCIYFDRNRQKYKFKDFSTDKQGDALTLVAEIFNLHGRREAAWKIIEDYNHFLIQNPNGHTPREFKNKQKYKVTDFTTRSWTTDDSRYWLGFHIGSKRLEKFKIAPLKDFTMEKTEDEELKQLTMLGPRIYGYFRNDGVLHKIYQPMVKECKFINVVDYIQGSEQLTGKVPYLIIASSMKDLMAFDTLVYNNAEAIAPNSENTMLPEYKMLEYINDYKKVITLFDNDEAGIRSMEKYTKKYNIPGVRLNVEKDLSDSTKKYGVLKIKEILTPLLKKALI